MSVSGGRLRAFDGIIGNDTTKSYLKRMLSTGKIGNSLLFAGPEGVGKGLFARALASILMGEEDRQEVFERHPDLHIYRPEGKIAMHSMAALRQFCEEVSLAPFESSWKVFIIHDAERMLPYSANALLKTFEEPPLDTVIILISSRPEMLLPTILSRCRKISFKPLSEQEIVHYLIDKARKGSEEAVRIAAMAQGSIGRAIKLCNDGESPLRTPLLDFLAKGKACTYKEIRATAKALAEGIEASKQAMEAAFRAHLQQEYADKLSAIQKQEIEKDVEGMVMMHVLEEASALFEIVLGWYRDLHYHAVNPHALNLYHPDRRKESQDAYESGMWLSLEDVQKHMADAGLAIERSTSFELCMENLFLKLTL